VLIPGAQARQSHTIKSDIYMHCIFRGTRFIMIIGSPWLLLVKENQ
jgi:hypothetical protein